MNLDLIKASGASMIRHALTVGAGWMLQHGYIAQSDVDTVIGAGMGLAAVAWALFHKRRVDVDQKGRV